ncbi:hypothetical protein [Blastochloris viridis]|uniref:Uncharacterized protein n=1 Tax=Blastochloris viridis TaxID=1079 RepID=A0A0H5BQG5_BLAVI|nr:hypothetical protein [Blastochloris viridis]ALK09224.1 hypothetical protein BVIR_1441 [Blastochloris viridis]BAS00909.1 hypothetical protein BV133_3315 [Blastochloris viridis]CUU41887.1 hypothetical protein BVIRIDIS_08860 [Blastochloris viridis]
MEPTRHPRKDPRLMTPAERIRAEEPWEMPALIGLCLFGIVGWAVITFGAG